MASNSALLIKLFCMGLLGLLILAPHAEAAISCGTVASSLAPCLSYIGGQPLNPKCCFNIKALKAAAATKADRQVVCGCLKGLAGNKQAVAKAPGLLKQCGVSIPYALNPKINCATVN
ncbi:OLC1v1013394C1 [Oldenlandia corymbosa var. corymbosa]|uniref:Non-specific lipid-transfer protein n=1 Tax=Oldenlandia corymbosa var. corymbosa TaxID=529605 RepID=A0AAV1E093_OLDCO|nr:OLC1v1013394C1 [Oldenlandia corymbosa var. corymbosa]